MTEEIKNIFLEAQKGELDARLPSKYYESSDALNF